MNVLVACEFSGRVTQAFRARGHEAYSCDIRPTIGNPWHHLQGDVRTVLQTPWKWDLMVAFPPCTYITAAGQARYADTPEREEALDFVRELMAAPIPRIAIENPRGAISTSIRRPDQTIEPYHFGDPYRKHTCLWLQGLPPLQPTNKVRPIGSWHDAGPRDGRRRGLTFRGIANAMADQWGKE